MTILLRQWDNVRIHFMMSVFQRPLSAISSPVWLPYTSIDQLLQALSETQTNVSVSLHFVYTTEIVSCGYFKIKAL